MISLQHYWFKESCTIEDELEVFILYLLSGPQHEYQPNPLYWGWGVHPTKKTKNQWIWEGKDSLFLTGGKLRNKIPCQWFKSKDPERWLSGYSA